MFKVTTITHVTDETSRPLICLTSRQGYRYLFGKVPEGAQRTINAIGSEVKYPKLRGLFLTGSIFSWSDIGGLPGLFLTVSDATRNGFRVVGNGKLLSYIVATWRQFVFRSGVSLDVVDAESRAEIKDDEIAITPILIEPAVSDPLPANSNIIVRQVKKLASLMFPLDTSEVNSRDPESYKSDPSLKDIHTHVHLPKASQIITSQASYSYLVRPLPVRGVFDPKKATELGLKPGPLFGKLTNGNPVVNEQGETIFPEQVVGPDRTYHKLLFIDIPSNDYYEKTINSDKWFAKVEGENSDDIGLVYHFLGEDLDFDLLHYTENFLAKFPSDTYHVISHPSMANNVILNDKLIANTITLKSLMNENFNLVNLEEFKPLTTSHIERLHSLQQYHMANGKVIPDSSGAAQATNKLLYDTQTALPGTANYEAMEATRIELDDHSGSSLKDKVQICMLGTGSALPSIQRNVLGNLVRIPFEQDDGSITYRSIVLDGGENTIGSLLRIFGHDNYNHVKQIFQELSLIHLSHLHADHHLGIVSLIGEWFKLNDTSKKLYLVAPWQFITFLKDWYSLELQYHPTFDINRLVCFSCEDFILSRREPEYVKLSIDEFEQCYDRKLLHKNIPRAPSYPVEREKIKEMYDYVGLNSIATVRALHCAWAYSSTFDFKLSNKGETFVLSFSGDTRPNPRFARLGFNSDLLIHEASLDTALIEEAIAKKHSAVIEAVAVSRNMNCPKLILTHFSTRYGISNNCVLTNELEGCANELSAYLNNSRGVLNIFESDTESKLRLEDIDIWYAYDLLSVRYGKIHTQEEVWPVLREVFKLSDEIDIDKINEKKEAKRMERLALKGSKRKRRKSA
ncbi:Ribonuclease Z [Candida viswanathii]|uniref:ribonuclease Z n=1 Tax=Candida viswanathii TaxID=5486 RepID=A0A367XM79_9ASCO|nr:Ribonuclease Z [Candida viswanathii]